MEDVMYSGKRGARISQTDVEVLTREFMRIWQERQELTPEVIVQEARPENSPLHRYFEWDNEVAGELYRREQARFYLRSIEVKIERVEAPVRAFHPVIWPLPEDDDPAPKDADMVFAPMTFIMHEERLMAQVVSRALRELAAWERKYRAIEALAKHCAKVREALNEMEQEALSQELELAR